MESWKILLIKKYVINIVYILIVIEKMLNFKKGGKK